MHDGIDFLRGLLDTPGGGRMLVFCHHQSVMDAIEERLLKVGQGRHRWGYRRRVQGRRGEGKGNSGSKMSFTPPFPLPPSPQVYPGGVGYIRIDGSTPDIKRKQAVDRFQAAAADGEPAEGSGGAAAAGSSKGRGGTSGGGGTPPMRVALLSITAAGVGLTLTAAEVI